jgi:hypothetical protein
MLPVSVVTCKFRSNVSYACVFLVTGNNSRRKLKDLIAVYVVRTTSYTSPGMQGKHLADRFCVDMCVEQSVFLCGSVAVC